MEKSTLRICSRSVAGIRPVNEDTCGVQQYDHPLGTVTLLAVADGLGGHPAGEVASALAVATLIKVTGERLPLLQDLGAEPLKLLMESAFREANNAVIAEGDGDVRCWGLGTTLVAALILFSGRMYYRQHRRLPRVPRLPQGPSDHPGSFPGPGAC